MSYSSSCTDSVDAARSKCLVAEAGHGMTLGAHRSGHSQEQQYAVSYFETLVAWLRDIARQ